MLYPQRKHGLMQLTSPDWDDRVPETEASPPVQIWRLRLNDLNGDPVETLRPLTVPAEHARARRYRFDADRHRHLAGRGLARFALSRQYDCAPQALSIMEGAHGKPKLQEPPSAPPTLHFNIAHTEDVVVVAVSRAHPVGIDVESRHRDADTDALARRVLTETERRRWQERPAPDQPAAFFHLWTCKEAFLKATGCGLQRAPDTVECTFDGDTVTTLTDAGGPPSSSDASAARWTVHPFLASAGVVGAVVYKHEGPASLAWTDAAPLLNRRASS